MNSFVVIALVAAISATAIAHGHHGYGGEEEYGPAKYDFEYKVHDPHTGDIKEQHEHRDGHHVKGSYSFKEADGTVRVVEYEAGPHSGFNAVVKRLGHAHHPQHYGHHGGHGNHGGHGHGEAQSHVGTTHYGYHH